MRTKNQVIEFPYGWEALKIVTSKPELILHTFPYSKDIIREGDALKVRFVVKKFFINFNFWFDLEVEFKKPEVTYVFRGDRGVLVITYTLNGDRLNIETSWSGFGERLMDKNLELFVKGIAESMKEITESYMKMKRIIHEKTPDGIIIKEFDYSKMPCLIKFFYSTVPTRDFTIVGEGEKGKFIVNVDNGVVTYVECSNEEKSCIVDIGKEALKVESGDFEALSLTESTYRVRILEKSSQKLSSL